MNSHTPNILQRMILDKRGFSFVYVLVFAIVSVSSAIVILLAYSIVSDTPINELVPDSVGNFIGSTNSNNQNNGEGFLGGFLGGLFGGNKKSGGGGGGGGGSSSGTGGNPLGDNNNTNQTHLACVSNTCAIVNGSGTDQCLSVGVACNQTTPAQCNDGISNDNDNWVDSADPGCTFIGDDNETNVYSPNSPQCGNELDDDGDEKIDGYDLECISPSDNDEGDLIISNAEYITPGNGWNNQLTDTPSANGTGPTPSGRWDFVPYQTLNNGEEIGIGVVAFHIYGIERVLFSVEGGDWKEVKEMTYNPYSRVWEYWVKMRASDFSNDGLKEIRAIIYPKVGQPRVLQGSNFRQDVNGIHSMLLNTNKNGDLLTHVRYVDAVSGDDVTGDGTQGNPFKTIVVAARDLTTNYGSSDGGIIYLQAGDHYWGISGSTPSIITNSRWLTIKPANGLTKNQVRINDGSSAGLATELVHLDNIHVNNTVVHTTGSVNSIWAENMLFTGRNLTDIVFPIPVGDWADGIYVTDSEYSTMVRAVGSYSLGRHLDVHDIGGDMFKTPRLLINVTGKNLIDANPGVPGTGPNPDIHRDVMQGQSALNNTIVYGLKAVENISGQNLFFSCGASNPDGTCISQDIAFVNYIVTSEGINPGKYGVGTNHLLIWHMTQGKKLLFPSSNNPSVIKTMTYLDIRNSVFGGLGGFDSQWSVNNGGAYAVNNHFIEGTPRGLNYTSGSSLSALFAQYTEWNSEDNDWHPSLSSMLRGANRQPYSVQRIVPVDFEGNQVPADGSGAIGSLQ